MLITLVRAIRAFKGSVRSFRQEIAEAVGAYHPMMFPPYERQTSLLIQRYHDNVRYSALALALHRIESDGIPGALAEVGVHRGSTSAFLRRTSMPSRKLYLFDTSLVFQKRTWRVAPTEGSGIRPLTRYLKG
jgi:hypothetical protein